MRGLQKATSIDLTKWNNIGAAEQQAVLVDRDAFMSETDIVNGKGAADAAVSSERHARLILRTSNSTSGPFFDEEGSYIDIIKHAAVATLAQIDPYAAAGAMAEGDEVEQLGHQAPHAGRGGSTSRR